MKDDKTIKYIKNLENALDYRKTLINRHRQNINDLMNTNKRLEGEIEAEKLLKEAAIDNHKLALTEVEAVKDASLDIREELEFYKNRSENYAKMVSGQAQIIADMPASYRKRRMDDRL